MSYAGAGAGAGATTCGMLCSGVESVPLNRQEMLASVVFPCGPRILSCRAVALCAVGRGQASALCTQCLLSESSLEAVAAGRAEYAGVLADLGFLDRASARLLGPSRGKGAGERQGPRVRGGTQMCIHTSCMVAT